MKRVNQKQIHRAAAAAASLPTNRAPWLQSAQVRVPQRPARRMKRAKQGMEWLSVFQHIRLRIHLPTRSHHGGGPWCRALWTEGDSKGALDATMWLHSVELDAPRGRRLAFSRTKRALVCFPIRGQKFGEHSGCARSAGAPPDCQANRACAAEQGTTWNRGGDRGGASILATGSGRLLMHLGGWALLQSGR